MKTKEQILAQAINCNESDLYSRGWVSPYDALRAMEEYRTQCIEYRRNLIINGAKWMRSLASSINSRDARIRELEEEKRRLEDDLGQKSMYYPDEPKN